MRSATLAALALACAGAAPAAVAAPPAQQLAAACAGCHAASPSGAASLSGLDADRIEQSMLDYRTGRRASQIMHVVASALTAAETEAVAQFLSRHTETAER